jgi:hypothetical protein
MVEERWTTEARGFAIIVSGGLGFAIAGGLIGSTLARIAASRQ